MHLNHFFLRRLAARLHQRLAGRAFLEEAFSQERDELVVALRLGGADGGGAEMFHIRAFMRAELTYLSFPDSFSRARANTFSLFRGHYGAQVVAVRAVPYDRSLVIELHTGGRLLYKLHGNRANVALLEEGVVTELFKNNLTADLTLTEAGLASAPDLSQAAFLAAGADAYKTLPQIGPESRLHLARMGYAETGPEQRWEMFQELLHTLETPPAYYICRWDGRTQLLLFAEGEVEQRLADPLEAAQAFARLTAYRFYLEQARREAVAALQRRREQTVQYLDKISLRRHELAEGRPSSEVADLVMAQLHKWAQGQRTAMLEDFYQENAPLEITIKEGQTPQAFATNLYKKAKNAHRELARLQEQHHAREDWLLRLEVALEEVNTLDDVRAIRRLVASMGPALATKVDEETLPYRPVHERGWEMRIGKNAVANDELLRHHTHKDDLWFHAKDVSGSHVILVHRSGQPYPRDIIEVAAGLAAYHSRKRTEKLADVIMAERKYIRKVKGTPPGSVRVEREKVLLVEPVNRS